MDIRLLIAHSSGSEGAQEKLHMIVLFALY